MNKDPCLNAGYNSIIKLLKNTEIIPHNKDSFIKIKLHNRALTEYHFTYFKLSRTRVGESAQNDLL